MNDYIRKNFNLPNFLTLIRLILVPVYWFFYLKYNYPAKILFFIFAFASFTDFLDGYLARKNNQITDFGKLADPLADKLMVLSVLLGQFMIGAISLVPVMIVAIKELLMIIGAFYMLKKDIVVSSNIYGKAATFLFMIALSLSILHEHFMHWIRIDTILIWASVVLSVFAMLTYARSAYLKLNCKK